MTQINYEQEVKKFYNNHVWAEWYDHFVDAKSGVERFCWIVLAGIGPISGEYHTEYDAWESAYETLKREGKI